MLVIGQFLSIRDFIYDCPVALQYFLGSAAELLRHTSASAVGVRAKFSFSLQESKQRLARAACVGLPK